MKYSSKVSKESACNAGDLSSIPGLGRSPGEGKGSPLLYSWASLVPQLVKSLPTMWETWVRSLGWEDSPGEGKGSPFQYSGLENPMYYSIQSWTQLSNFHFLHLKLTQHCESTILQYKIKIVKKREKLGGKINNVGLVSFFTPVVLLLATY